MLLAGIPINSSVLSPALAEAQEQTPVDWQEYASTTAKNAGLSPVRFQKVIQCESNWVATSTGDNGTSFGMVQIHLPAHPDVTLAEADDPYFAINFMAHAWQNGNENWWSCYTILYGNKTGR